MRKVIISVLILLFFVVSMSNFISGTSWSSPNKVFNVTPDGIYLNWTNSYQADITLGMNTSYSGALKLWNDTNTISPEYGQPRDNYQNFCGYSPSVFEMYVINSTGSYTYNTSNLNGGESASMTLVGAMHESCPPGRYYGHLKISNSTNANEYYSLPVTIDVPISSSNELNTTTGIGYFKGVLPAYASTYQSYYFNTSAITNSTGITMKLSWSGSSDVDLFLFDENGNLKAKSINTGASESLSYNYPPQGKMWEIKIYGNSSSPIEYNSSGEILFSTLNATNASNPSQRLSMINFGDMNASDERNVKIKLKNEGPLVLNSVSQSSELYHLQTFSDTSPKNFSVRVPDFATRMRAEVEWSNGANYTINIYNPNGALIDSSTNKYSNAGVVGVEKEEYVEYDPSGTIGLDGDGLWTVEIKNNTPTTGSYNMTFKEWFGSDWISTNYTTMTFNTSGNENDSAIVDFNFTVKNSSLSGLYNGFLRYTTSQGAILEVPFAVNVTTPELFVNNTYKQSTINLKDNTGFNKTLLLEIPIKNTGNKEIVFDQVSRSPSLKYSSYYIDFTDNYPSSLAPGTSGTLNITINLDATKTNNILGIYSGWIVLNDTDSHPYSTFNLSIDFDLTNEIYPNIVEINTSDNDNWVENVSSSQNITVKVHVYFADGGEMNDLNISNFHSVYLDNENYTNYKIPSSGHLSIYEATNPFYLSGKYWLYVSLPGDSSRPGGYYDVYLSTNRTEDGATLTGTTHGGTLIINNSALYLSTNDAHISLDEGTTGSEHFNLSVTNYGPLTAKGTLNLDWSSDCDYLNDIDPVSIKSGCGSVSGNGFKVDISDGDTCWYTWRFDAKNVTSDETCAIDVLTSDPTLNTKKVYVEIDNIASPTPNQQNQNTNNNESNTNNQSTAAKIEISQYPSSINVIQGETESFPLSVKNAGDTSQSNLTLYVSGIPDTWYSYSPSHINLNSGDEENFTINITPSKSAPIKTYVLNFTVKNSNVWSSNTSVLKVLPCEEEKSKINKTYEIYLSNYTSLMEKMSLLSKRENVTILNNTLRKLKSKLDLVEQSISKGDYFTADQLLGDVYSLITEAENLSTEKGSASAISLKSSNIVWIAVGVIAIIIVAFLVYLMLPSREEYRMKSFRASRHIKYRSPSEGEPIDKKIRRVIRSFIRKVRFASKRRK
ncbi:MAG: hypothetical protein J7K87_00125 [Candidatus Aenigmarchaeota archaeon]|nr:hypothetical protein [Candidatus Aenigmarchaeota archaeon]